MPPRGLPGNANLEQLKNGAKSFARAVRAGDPGAVEVVREFHPRLADATPGSPALAEFKRSDAQLVVARSFGFPSWPRLKSHLELVAPLSRAPHEVEPRASSVDEFLRLACLTYGNDDPARWAQASAKLGTSPEMAHANIAVIAAVGNVEAARAALRSAPDTVRLPLGPHRWEPLLYLTYSRVVTGSAVETARLLLDNGADPNTGYLWEGLVPPFTALTGVFGSGGGNQPPHPEWHALARLLLERGADPNDGQTIYNNGGNPDNEWLELLLEFGLGRGDGGPWARLLGDQQDTPQKMTEDALMAAAHHGFVDRVRLLLRHGVDPAGARVCHPTYEGRRPAREAALWGHPEIVELLGGADLDEVDSVIAAAMTGDRRAIDPALVAQAIARHPAQLVKAAETGSLPAVRLLIELGFDVNARERRTALHEAALRGDVKMIELLIEHGADPSIRDTGYHATPAGWAEHFGHREAQRYLAALEPPE